jgi:hypothetical protein
MCGGTAGDMGRIAILSTGSHKFNGTRKEKRERHLDSTEMSMGPKGENEFFRLWEKQKENDEFIVGPQRDLV